MKRDLTYTTGMNKEKIDGLIESYSGKYEVKRGLRDIGFHSDPRERG
jgi:hypothetical protein